MSIKRYVFICGILKKTASVIAAFLLFANPVLVSKDGLKSFINGFDPSGIVEVGQNVFNVSAHINKAAGTISRLFRFNASGEISQANQNQQKEDAKQNNNIPLNAVTAAFAGNFDPAVFSGHNTDSCAHVDGFAFYGVYADHGGGGLSPGFEFLISYFIAMLLFFASSRKVFNGIFNFKMLKYRLIF
ncbi:MAG: hypothetical protein LBL00_06505 [Endomicrobium sp.]|jgi:hypothetical protein|nr:hypothetical protein [Endomicrobium sp.]